MRCSADARTKFDVAVANVRVNQVYVVGEVAQPGTYQISALGTVMTALYAAGGPTERGQYPAADRGSARRGKLAASVDLYDYLLHGNTQNDVRLETGDVVYVPIYNTRVQIVGAVPRPAVYDFLPGQTLADAIKAAGGFRPRCGAPSRLTPTNPARRLSRPRARAPSDDRRAIGPRRQRLLTCAAS